MRSLRWRYNAVSAYNGLHQTRRTPPNMKANDLKKVYRNFTDELYRHPHDSGYPISYGICEVVRKVHWGLYGELAVSRDLEELVNFLHDWYEQVRSWSAWVKVLKSYDGNDAWHIQRHCIRPVAFFCMFQPSAFRDRLGTISTQAIHQANLCIDSTYLDRLDQDDDHGGFLPRRRSEKQLARIGRRWPNYNFFETTLKRVDSPEYREATKDYRNLASHGTPPHFEWGETNVMTRSIVPWSELVDQGDGTYQLVEHPTRKAVSYGFGGMHPVALSDMLEINKKQLTLAFAAFHAYQALIEEMIVALDSA